MAFLKCPLVSSAMESLPEYRRYAVKVNFPGKRARFFILAPVKIYHIGGDGRTDDRSVFKKFYFIYPSCLCSYAHGKLQPKSEE